MRFPICLGLLTVFLRGLKLSANVFYGQVPATGLAFVGWPQLYIGKVDRPFKMAFLTLSLSWLV